MEPFSAYIHIPFCSVRCGYCDFNTYVADFDEGADRRTYHRSIVEEVRFASRFFDQMNMERPALQSVFFGGGTPSLLHPEAIGEVMGELSKAFGISPATEVTLEANPDTLTVENAAMFQDAGVNRFSVGMQSAVPHVLETLDRTHKQESVGKAVEAARAAGVPVSLDLIYGAPGESLSDWEETLRAALALKPDHISAYSLIIEEGTKMGTDLRLGRIEDPNPDLEAEKYLAADKMLGDAGFHWYEISNFASSEGTQSVHNKAYWSNASWWGFGAGSHSHLLGARWWNARHPTAYAGYANAGVSPSVGGEILTPEERAVEDIMLSVRTSLGVSVEQVAEAVRTEQPEAVGKAEGVVQAEETRPHTSHVEEATVRLERLAEEGLLEDSGAGRFSLTLDGRLLADLVTRRLLGWE